MNLSEYQELSKRTLPDHLTWDDKKNAISNYSMGLAGEAGEVIDVLKKFVHHGHTLNIHALEEELGDLLHYVAGTATILGLSLEGIATGNIEKLRKRYPKGFSSRDSINRNM